jgi:hypothetical protein
MCSAPLPMLESEPNIEPRRSCSAKSSVDAPTREGSIRVKPVPEVYGKAQPATVTVRFNGTTSGASIMHTETDTEFGSSTLSSQSTNPTPTTTPILYDKGLE